MKPIAIFYHAVFSIEGRELPSAVPIIREQMKALEDSGLLDAADQLQVGINGGTEGQFPGSLIEPLFLLPKTKLTYHNQQCRNELRTILMLEKSVKEHGDEWLVFYHHAKGSTHPVGHDLSTRWRRCMQRHLVTNWRQCVKDLETVESVGCHWMEPPATPATQYIWGGNFWWARNSFLKTLPSIMERARLKDSGIDALESRYEAEVFVGNGPRPPTHIDYHGPNWTPAKIHTCEAGLQRYGVRRKVLT